MPNCLHCRYRALPTSANICDYFTMTGTTRHAQPRTQCTHFASGERGGSEWRKLVPVERVRKPYKMDADRALALYREGWTDVSIGREIGVADSTVRAWRKRMGLGVVAKKVRSD